MTQQTLAAVSKALIRASRLPTDQECPTENLAVVADAMEALALLDAETGEQREYRMLEAGKDILCEGDESYEGREWIVINSEFIGDGVHMVNQFRRPITKEHP